MSRPNLLQRFDVEVFAHLWHVDLDPAASLEDSVVEEPSLEEAPELPKSTVNHVRLDRPMLPLRHISQQAVLNLRRLPNACDNY